eukprot:3180369-Prymnesium_polylepis.1
MPAINCRNRHTRDDFGARFEHPRTPRTLDRRCGTLGSLEHTVGGNDGPVGALNTDLLVNP